MTSHFFWRFVSLPAGNDLLPMVAIGGGVGASQADPSSPMTLPLWDSKQSMSDQQIDVMDIWAGFYDIALPTVIRCHSSCLL